MSDNPRTVRHYSLFDEPSIFDLSDSKNWTGPVKNETMFPDWICENLYGNELLLILFSFALSMVLAPWSWGIIFFFIFLVVWEIGMYLGTRGKPPFWFLEVRLAIVAASVLGWLVGRELTGKDADKLDPLLDRPPKDTDTES